MKKPILIVAVLVIFSLFSNTTFAQTTPPAPTPAAPAPAAGGGDAVASLTSSDNYTALSIAIRAAGLAETLEGAGPYTIFAPTNEAFAKLPAGTVDNLVKPENKATLTKILTYHVVAGRLSAAELWAKVKAGNGKAELITVQGGKLTVMSKGKKLYLVDEKGGESWITIADVNQSNGVIHVVNAVLMPN